MGDVGQGFVRIRTVAAAAALGGALALVGAGTASAAEPGGGTAVTPTTGTSAVSIPVWGNWCGPGYGAGAPVDVLDGLCRQHDLCYRDNGYFHRTCNRQLTSGITRSWALMRPAEQAMAGAIYVTFVAWS